MNLTDAIEVLVLTIHAHASAADRQEHTDATDLSTSISAQQNRDSSR
jgi:hypothetical protein